MKEKLNRLKSEAKGVGQKINEKKTKEMRINLKNNTKGRRQNK
jgi:hypothetical protein